MRIFLFCLFVVIGAVLMILFVARGDAEQNYRQMDKEGE